MHNRRQQLAWRPRPLPYATNTAAASQPAIFLWRFPSALNDPALAAYPASQLHPYDHHRAALIGLSTALVAAIVIIVSLMSNFSTHKDSRRS